jgi:hypothetical protein
VSEYSTTGGSTSAQLLRMQTAYAASQADLTRVERELADAESDRMKAERERDEALAAQERIGDRLTESAVRLAAYRVGLDAARRERDLALGELATARAELERLHKTNPEGAPMTDHQTLPGGEGGSVTGAWRRSSYCGTNACVEALVHADGGVSVRHSEYPFRALNFSAEEWEAFRQGVLAGEFGGGTDG